VSNDNGDTWEQVAEFSVNLKHHGCVWNCPRLSYVDNNLYIICDQKSSTEEKTATFKTIILVSADEGKTFHRKETPLPGMVPDKIIEFKGNLFCANHKIKSSKNDLIQLISWSRDKGKTWYDTNIMAHGRKKQYCEASIVNMGSYLIGYLRENSGHKRMIYAVMSEDGIHWNFPHKLPMFGQRVTALKDEDEDGNIIGAYRDTNLYNSLTLQQRLRVSAFEHNIDARNIDISKIDWEYPENQYHFGYTGMVRIEPNKYIIAYYLKRRAMNPFIKLAYVSKTKI
jgi:hypothetical protein